MEEDKEFLGLMFSLVYDIPKFTRKHIGCEMGIKIIYETFEHIYEEYLSDVSDLKTLSVEEKNKETDDFSDYQKEKFKQLREMYNNMKDKTRPKGYLSLHFYNLESDHFMMWFQRNATHTDHQITCYRISLSEDSCDLIIEFDS